MKKSHADADYVSCCGLCEHSSYFEYDDRYICKYKNKCTIVAETDCCRHFSFDLLKIAPPKKLPYTPANFDIPEPYTEPEQEPSEALLSTDEDERRADTSDTESASSDEI